MAVTVVIAAVLFLVVWLRYIYGYRRAPATGVAIFYGFYQPVLSRLLRPVAIAFWRGVSDLTLIAAGSVQKIYTGNGQTYGLYVLWYIIAVHAIGSLIH